ncbi:spore germination protein GerW family protein [Pengzhenrongella sicca]|uniref:Sporulation protein n=1 Tax=Pengzhenrongella sicca TaxID=2819238 RepID=A0A8A4ZI65_9MICO|nr:spore germination protein GerW family protein [Pengzhenrongella sicca]QTE30683.1 hypothetical protein J4E96_06900 [Pengzhenrongella sicca]
MPDSPAFDPAALTRAASDVLTVRRVFGEAYERGGTLVIPVAKIMGGTGNGSGTGSLGAGAAREEPGHGPHGESEGSGGGGGFAVRVRPIGAYVIDDSGVHWRPALDLNRVILGGQAVGIVVSLALALALRRRRR